MEGFIVAAAVGGFDRDGRVAEGGEVVGAGAHVELAQGEGEVEGVHEDVAADPRHGFVGPLVEVHVGVEAAWLFEVRAGVERQGVAVERLGGGGEEPERVKVGAQQRARGDERVDVRLREAQRDAAGVADILGAEDHRPLVEAVAGEVGLATGGGPQECGDPSKPAGEAGVDGG